MEHARLESNNTRCCDAKNLWRGLGVAFTVQGVAILAAAPAITDWPKLCTVVFVYGTLCCAGAVASMAAQ